MEIINMKYFYCFTYCVLLQLRVCLSLWSVFFSLLLQCPEKQIHKPLNIVDYSL